MKGFISDINSDTNKNQSFRRVLYTSDELQLTLMSIDPGEDIGEETHDSDQFFRVERGYGEVWIDGKVTKIKGGSGIIIPSGAKHNILNTGDIPLKMYSLYAPPMHLDKAVHRTKEDSEDSDESWDGETTE